MNTLLRLQAHYLGSNSFVHRSEIQTYLARLLSHDAISREQLALYGERRRRSLLFFAVKQCGMFRDWAIAHPSDARYCTSEGWAQLPIECDCSVKPRDETVSQHANLLRILKWWGVDGNVEDLRRARVRNPLPGFRPRKPGAVRVGTPAQLESLRSGSTHLPGGQATPLDVWLVDTPSDLQSRSRTDSNSSSLRCLGDGGMGIWAAPCPSGNYHALTDVFLFEINKGTNTTLITDLDDRNPKTLSIRVRLDYALSFSDTACNCGRPFPVLELEAIHSAHE
jgi:hypothetical protein